MILYTAWVIERQRTGLHWLSSSWCHIPVRSLDYTEEHAESESYAQIINIRRNVLTTTNWSPPKKTKDADAGTCALVLSIPGVWRVNLQCGRAVSACIRAHTPVCSASRHPSHPPLTNLTHFYGLNHHLNTDLQGDSLPSLVCLTRDYSISLACLCGNASDYICLIIRRHYDI